MTSQKQIINNTKAEIYKSIKAELEEITETAKEKEIYFCDIISRAVDSNTPTNRQECLNLIDTAEPQFFDSGLIDNRDIDRTLITSAYCSIEQNLFNNDFIQELQNQLNNEIINPKQARLIIKLIEQEEEKEGFNKVQNRIKYEDTATQIFLRTPFKVQAEDFKQYIEKGFLIENQIINLSDGVKILTSNNSINENALIIEEKKRAKKDNKILRVYLMEKTKKLDIRNLFKLDCISEETGFNLSPSAYIEQTTEQYEQDKTSNPLKKNYLTEFKDKEHFLKFIIRIVHGLTKISIKEKEEKENKKENIDL